MFEMLNGEILSQDRVVAQVKNNRRTVIDPDHCPLYLRKYDDVEGWLTRRSIDAHRTNSRLLRKALRLAPNDDLGAVLRVHGATITDSYWYREEGETLTYNQVRFGKENPFSQLALRGDPDSFRLGSAGAVTPELTNTGSFEKCWENHDGVWWMIKAGNDLEQFSELFVYRLGDLLGLPMAHYERDGEYIRSKDFTEGRYDFEPAYGVMLEEEDYVENYHRFREICPRAAALYVGMVYLDGLVANMDRHTNNYGFLRDQETGELLTLAPLFDHNIALVARGYPSSSLNRGGMLNRDFADLLKEEPQALKDFLSLGLTPPTESIVREAARQANDPPFSQGTVRENFLVEFVMSAHEWIEDQVQGLLPIQEDFEVTR